MSLHDDIEYHDRVHIEPPTVAIVRPVVADALRAQLERAEALLREYRAVHNDAQRTNAPIAADCFCSTCREARRYFAERTL